MVVPDVPVVPCEVDISPLIVVCPVLGVAGEPGVEPLIVEPLVPVVSRVTVEVNGCVNVVPKIFTRIIGILCSARSHIVSFFCLRLPGVASVHALISKMTPFGDLRSVVRSIVIVM